MLPVGTQPLEGVDSQGLARYFRYRDDGRKLKQKHRSKMENNEKVGAKDKRNAEEEVHGKGMEQYDTQEGEKSGNAQAEGAKRLPEMPSTSAVEACNANLKKLRRAATNANDSEIMDIVARVARNHRSMFAHKQVSDDGPESKKQRINEEAKKKAEVEVKAEKMIKKTDAIDIEEYEEEEEVNDKIKVEKLSWSRDEWW